jgi:hypothetical protein
MVLDLQSLFWLHVHSWLNGCDHATSPFPRIWAHIRGRYGLAKIKTTSLCNPLVEIDNVVEGREETRKIGIHAETRDRQV